MELLATKEDCCLCSRIKKRATAEGNQQRRYVPGATGYSMYRIMCGAWGLFIHMFSTSRAESEKLGVRMQGKGRPSKWTAFDSNSRRERDIWDTAMIITEHLMSRDPTENQMRRNFIGEQTRQVGDPHPRH